MNHTHREQERWRRHAACTGIGPAVFYDPNPAAEATSYLRHGYRYVGETFRPHVTLGRTTSDRLALPASCCADYDAEILGRTVRFDRLVVYRAGPFGRLVEIIADL